MKTYNTYFTNQDVLKEFLSFNDIEDSSSLLIQVFSCNYDVDYIDFLVHLIDKLLPNAVIIGTTTDGLIKDGLISLEGIALSFTQFEDTSLELFSCSDLKQYFDTGVEVANTLIESTTKVIVSFIDATSSKAEEYLNGIASTKSDVVVSGGVASDNQEFNKTFVFNKKGIVTNGVVAVALNSTKLHVYRDYAFHWVPIGLELKVTQCDKNRVYRIDNRSAVETYRYYLGDDIANRLPQIGIEFPLIIKHHDIDVSRAVISKEKDGSLIFGGNLRQGDTVQFGYGDSVSILDASIKTVEKMRNIPIESIFLYSSMKRRRFMPDTIEQETLAFNAVAPNSGFFAYGEFYTSSSYELLNETMSILALSESDTIKPFAQHELIRDENEKDETMKALSHIAKVTAFDTQQKNQKQTKIYTRLHNIGKELNKALKSLDLYEIASDFIINELNFEKLIIFEYEKQKDRFSVVLSSGDDSSTQKNLLPMLNLLPSGKVIEALCEQEEPIVHTPTTPSQSVESLMKSLFLQESYFELFGGDIEKPYGLIVVGNSSENYQKYTRIALDDMEMLALGNFTVQLSNSVNNILYYNALIQEKKTLKESILNRTRQINKQKETFETIYKTSKDGIAILDIETTAFLDANQAYADMTGFTLEELMQRSCKELSAPEDRDRSAKAIEKVIKNGFITNFIKTCMVKDDKKVIINMSISLMGDRKRMLVSAKDITTDKERERQITLMHQYTKDSIEYASLIQHAILSSKNELNNYFSDSFTIWRPKDVVGGDIYFFQEINENEVIIMLIDCTGHGVHGAFVTMLVKGIERQIIGEILYSQKEINTAKILQKFNKRMKKLLHQQKNQKQASNAGFDGGILYYNKEKKIIKYSGAQTPLFIVRDGASEIIKGDKHSIGYIDSDLTYQFKEYQVDVSNGANIYMSSDGYLDQIGGEKSFMFGKKRFVTLLEKSIDRSFIDQKQILENTFDTYRHDQEQKDDLTVVGLKISKEVK
ncbi:MAG: FIST N-terminal domain-containing protein [Campylobacterota bacterium]|nr:FIST N-terminal domain-containing protein [Campylobacterota bacterium]